MGESTEKLGARGERTARTAVLLRRADPLRILTFVAAAARFPLLTLLRGAIDGGRCGALVGCIGGSCGCGCAGVAGVEDAATVDAAA